MKFLYLSATALAIVAGACTPRAPRMSAGPQPAVDAGTGATAVAARRTGIDWTTRVTLAWARAADYSALSVAIMTERPGKAATDSLAAAVSALGGQIETRFDELGYMRAVLPLAAIPKIGDIAGVADYETVQQRAGGNFSGRAHTQWRPSVEKVGKTEPGDERDTTLPMLTPAKLASDPRYLAEDEVRLDVFARREPLADGRGVTIGIPEGLFNYPHEAFREARTLAGDTVAKIAGLLDATWYKPRVYVRQETDPRERIVLRRGGAETLVRVDTTVTTADGHITMSGGAMTLPERGSWRVGRWGRAVGEQLHPDTLWYLVAWRDTLGLWVDLNRDRDLRNDGGVVPNINVRVEPRRFPADSAAGAPSPVTFTVVYDSSGLPHIYDAVWRWNSHTTMVAGTSAGSRFLGSNAGGIAPGARLVSVLSQNEFEDMLIAARDGRTDVIVSTAGNGHFPADGGSFTGRMLARLSQVYGKTILVSAANSGPALGTVQHTSASAGVLGVGAYVSKRSYANNESWNVPDDDNLTLYSGRGPAADGALKPDFVAPTQTVTADVCDPTAWAVGRRRFRLPPCYMIGGGTSNSAPFAAGVTARLISAARLKGWPANAYDPPTIAWALTASARALAGFGLHEQGAGLIQVDSAWALMQVVRDRPGFASSGPVENAYAPYLLNPGRGPGLYLREGWTVGRREERTIALRRTSGPAAPTRYRLRWRGNDGSFALADSTVTLARGASVDLRVTVAPLVQGIHTAAIEVVDASADIVYWRVPAIVVAGFTLTPANGFSARQTDSIAWPRTRSVFVNVPRGTGVLRLDVSFPSGFGTVYVRGPLAADGMSSQLPSGYGGPTSREAVIRIADPMPGTWEFTFSPPTLTGSDEPPANQRMLVYSLVATAFMAKVEAAADRGDEQVVTFVNSGAAIPKASVRTTVGVRRVFEGTVGASPYDGPLPLDPIVIAVDSGTSTLRVSLAIDGDAATLTRRADLYLFTCPGPEDCRAQAPIFTDAGRQELIVPKPDAGTWKIVVDPVRVREKPMRYTLTVIATHPKWKGPQRAGSADTVARPLAAGERWSVPVGITAPVDRGANGAALDFVGVTDLLSHDVLATSAGASTAWQKQAWSDEGPSILAQRVVSLAPRGSRRPSLARQ